jgi:hypothetical protein
MICDQVYSSNYNNNNRQEKVRLGMSAKNLIIRFYFISISPIKIKFPFFNIER